MRSASERARDRTWQGCMKNLSQSRANHTEEKKQVIRGRKRRRRKKCKWNISVTRLTRLTFYGMDRRHQNRNCHMQKYGSPTIFN